MNLQRSSAYSSSYSNQHSSDYYHYSESKNSPGIEYMRSDLYEKVYYLEIMHFKNELEAVVKTFFNSNSLLELNLTHKIKSNVLKEYKISVSPIVFREAFEETLALLGTDSYNEFIKYSISNIGTFQKRIRYFASLVLVILSFVTVFAMVKAKSRLALYPLNYGFYYFATVLFLNGWYGLCLVNRKLGKHQIHSLNEPFYDTHEKDVGKLGLNYIYCNYKKVPERSTFRFNWLLKRFKKNSSIGSTTYSSPRDRDRFIESKDENLYSLQSKTRLKMQLISLGLGSLCVGVLVLSVYFYYKCFYPDIIIITT